MKTTFLSATALAFALATPSVLAAPTTTGDPAAGRAETGRLAQANPPQSRPGTPEQGGQRTGDPGTAAAPTSTTGAPPTRPSAVPMPSTMPSAGQPADPTKANEATGMRAGDPGARPLPGTPGSGPQVGTDRTTGTAGGSMTAPGATSPDKPKGSDATGMRTGDPGARQQQPTGTRQGS
ncbi:hypothetical protein [Stella sp.]|uniref:hypothetical protein n=1 Tax=Stella sp. TaxID=2912054 RepID=UPI0035B27618